MRGLRWRAPHGTPAPPRAQDPPPAPRGDWTLPLGLGARPRGSWRPRRWSAQARDQRGQRLRPTPPGCSDPTRGRRVEGPCRGETAGGGQGPGTRPDRRLNPVRERSNVVEPPHLPSPVPRLKMAPHNPRCRTVLRHVCVGHGVGRGEGCAGDRDPAVVPGARPRRWRVESRRRGPGPALGRMLVKGQGRRPTSARGADGLARARGDCRVYGLVWSLV